MAREEPSNQKASNNAARFREQAIYGIRTLRQFALTTDRGAGMLDVMAASIGLSEARLPPPGMLN